MTRLWQHSLRSPIFCLMTTPDGLQVEFIDKVLGAVSHSTLLMMAFLQDLLLDVFMDMECQSAYLGPAGPAAEPASA